MLTLGLYRVEQDMKSVKNRIQPMGYQIPISDWHDWQNTETLNQKVRNEVFIIKNAVWEILSPWWRRHP